MVVILDVVDLLQLQEVWSWRPIVIACNRLQRRDPPPDQPRFELEALGPRLTQLRQSPVWRQNHPNHDPAKLPLRDFLAAEMAILFPDTDETTVRQQVFRFAYQAFVVAQYQGALAATVTGLRALAAARCLPADDYLNAQNLPREGSPDWIPADITDEIRSLDERYRPAEAGTPAAYVIADQFWPLLIKAEATDLETAARHHTGAFEFTHLLEVARAWNRSPSVVGLCYQVQLEEM